jgi:hypothetical protein
MLAITPYHGFPVQLCLVVALKYSHLIIPTEMRRLKCEYFAISCKHVCSGMAALTTFDKNFTPSPHPILPQPGPPPWRTSAVTIDHTSINPDIDTKSTGHFAIHHQPTQSNVAIRCFPIVRDVTTLSLDCINHLERLFRPVLTHLTFEGELYRFVTCVGTASEIDNPTTSDS